MEHLGTFLMEYPNMFLKDQFIKYVGWMLHDKVSRPHRAPITKASRENHQTTRVIIASAFLRQDARVRAASAQVLVDLYGHPENMPKLENFTLRFLKRLQVRLPRCTRL